MPIIPESRTFDYRTIRLRLKLCAKRQAEKRRMSSQRVKALKTLFSYSATQPIGSVPFHCLDVTLGQRESR